MAAWPGQGLDQKATPLIHVLDCTQIPPVIHKFLTLSTRWSRQDCEGGQCTFIPIARKMNQDLWATTTIWGHIIIYRISPWLSVLALISIPNLLAYFLMMLALLGILSQSVHFYFIWHETVRLLRVSLYHSSICIYLFFLITAETARVGSCPTFRKICLSLDVYKYGDPDICF